MTFKQSTTRSGAEPDEVPVDAGWLTRANAFGERHARVIITISTVLVIVIVVIIGVIQREKADIERAGRDLAAAESIEDLKELQAKYKDSPVGPIISCRLANRYQEENSLAEAAAEYANFRKLYPNDPLMQFVQDAEATLLENIRFEEKRKDLLLKQHTLQTHPRRMPGSGDPLFQEIHQILPPPHAGTQVEIVLATGAINVRLYEDEAPETTADFLKRCDANEFTGLKVEIVGDAERFQILPRDGAVATSIPREKTSRPAVEGALVMIPAGDGNAAGRFQILLKDLTDLKGVTVFGTVIEGLPRAMSPGENPSILDVRIPYRRPGS